MEILENAGAWSEDFTASWLAHLKRTGEIDWNQYRPARNRVPIVAPGIDPTSARLLLVSTAGAYLANEHEAFDAANPYGDYSIRTFSADTDLAGLDYSHNHYDHAARHQDPRVNLPLGYLADMANNGELGSVTDSVVSYSGYQPDAGAVVDTVIPEILRVAAQEGAQAALLVPV